jgi:hypothetical protein
MPFPSLKEGAYAAPDECCERFRQAVCEGLKSNPRIKTNEVLPEFARSLAGEEQRGVEYGRPAQEEKGETS